MYSFKRIDPSNWPAIALQVMEIEETVFLATGLNQSEGELKARFEDPASICFIARDCPGGQVVGYITCAPLEEMVGSLPIPQEEVSGHFWARDTGYVDSIAVLPPYQRSGIGRNLLEAVIGQAQEKGMDRISGHWLPTSQGLFESLGGICLATYPHYVPEHGIPADYMVLKLKESEDHVHNTRWILNHLGVPTEISGYTGERIALFYRTLILLGRESGEEGKEQLSAIIQVLTQFEGSIGDIARTSPDDDTLDLIFRYMEVNVACYKTLRDKYRHAQDAKKKSDPDVSLDFLGSTRLFLKSLPSTLLLVKRDDLIDEYKYGLETAVQMCDVTISGSSNRCSHGRQLTYYDGDSRTVMGTVRRAKELGHSSYGPFIIGLIGNNSIIEPGHAFAGITDFVDDCLPYQATHKVEFDAFIDFVGRLRGCGSALYHTACFFPTAMKQLVPSGRTHLLVEYMKLAQPFLGLNPRLDWDFVNFDKLAHAIEEYDKKGALPQFEKNMQALSELNGLFHVSSDYRLHALHPFLPLLTGLPQLYDTVGEIKAQQFYDEVIELAKQELQNTRLACAGTVTNGFVRNILHLLEESPDEFTRLMSDDNRYTLLMTMMKGAVARPYNMESYKINSAAHPIIKAARDIDDSQRYIPVAEVIGGYGLIRSLPNLNQFMEAGMGLEELRAVLRHFSVVQYIPELRAFAERDLWYHSIAGRVGLSESEVVQWMEAVLASDYYPEYSQAVPMMIRYGVGLEKGLELMPVLHETGLTSSIGDLAFIINSNEARATKESALRDIQPYKNLLLIHPPHSFDIDMWKQEAELKTKTFLQDEFGYSPPYELTNTHVLRIAAAAQDSATRVMIRQMIELETEGRANLTGFTPGKLYARRRVTALTESLSFVDATQHLVYGLISRLPE